MGFLDSATNSIILDAVLTDIGRQFLARNDGSFSIAKYAFADDEINYNVITKYGRTVGREKLEKNTPILEALTNQQHALKHKLVSVSNPNLLRLPSLTLSGDANVNASALEVTLGRVTQRTALVTLEQTIQNEAVIDVELRDQTFLVEVPNLFMQISGQVPESIDGQQRASYLLVRSPNENSFGGSFLSMTLQSKSVSDATFTVYGTTADKTRIKSYVKVTGLSSGASSEFAVILDKDL